MKKLIILTLLITVFNCSSDDENSNEDNTNPDIDYSQFIIEDAIDTDIFFFPQELYETTEIQAPSLKLYLSSVEIYPCANYSLITTEFMIGDELIIRFEEVFQPEICLTAFGPATSYVDLPLNTERITFINGDNVDRYIAEINEEKVNISLLESSFTESVYDKTFRIPENSFAYVCGTNTNNTNIYTDFLAILEQNQDFTEFEFEGEGRIPYPETTFGNNVNHPSRFFTYSSPEEFSNLANVLNDFSAEHIEPNSGVSITIVGWNSVRYYSWVDN